MVTEYQHLPQSLAVSQGASDALGLTQSRRLRPGLAGGRQNRSNARSRRDCPDGVVMPTMEVLLQTRLVKDRYD